MNGKRVEPARTFLHLKNSTSSHFDAVHSSCRGPSVLVTRETSWAIHELLKISAVLHIKRERKGRQK